MNSDGIGGMVKAGAWLSNLLDLEVLGCGRAGDAPAHSGKLELSGRFLAYDITLDGGWIFVSAAVMDRGDPPECLLTIADNAENWRTVSNSSPRSNAAPSASYSPGRWRLDRPDRIAGLSHDDCREEAQEQASRESGAQRLAALPSSASS